MAVLLAQSTVGSSFSGSVASGSTALTSPAGFSGSTVAGNLLIAVVYAKGSTVSNFEVSAPTIGGATTATS